jgi:hypothetical protein
LSSNIVDYLKLSGDRVVVVPDGVYTAGSVVASHPATGGPFGGWLVLQAETPGGVVVDMAKADLELLAGSSRVLFVGFRFANGLVSNAGTDIAYWYTDHQFDHRSWQAESPRVHRVPRIFHTASGSQRVRVYGSDFHNGTATAVYLGSGSRQVVLQGIKIWDVYERVPDPDDILHVNTISGNSLIDLTVRDTYVVGRNKFMASKGNHTGLVIDNVWSTGAPGTGFQIIAMDGDSVQGVRRNVRSWAHNGAGVDRLDIIDGQQQRDHNANPGRIYVLEQNNTTTPPPPGAIDPATAWRNANPYNSWPTFFGWS